MGTVLGSLADLGYWWAYRVLDAQYAGVAQRRRRVFIVGHSGDRAAPAKVLLEPDRRTWNPAPRREAGQRVADSLTVGANQYSGFPGEPVELAQTLTSGMGTGGQRPAGRQTFIPTISHAVTTHQVKGGDPTTDNYVAHTLRSEGADASEDGTGRGTPLVSFNWQNAGNEGYAFTKDGTGPLDASQTKAVIQSFAQNQRNEVRTSNVVSNLNNGGGKPGQGYAAVMDGVAVRRLTPTECLRLQGFPDHWLDLDPPLSDSAKYRMTGNAVCANVAEWIGRRITEYEAST